MKRLLLLLAVVPSVFFAVSCDPVNTDGPDNGGDSKDKTDIRLIDAQSEYKVASDIDTVMIRFTVTLDDSAAAWKVTASQDWCKPEPAEGSGYAEVFVAISANDKASAREAELVISAGTKTKKLKVTQCMYAGAMPAESWFTKPYYERTDREKAGLRGPVKSWYVSTYTTYDKYYYDEAGHLVKEEYYNTTDNYMEVRWVHSYDAQGRRVKSEQSYGSDAEGGRTFTYEYGNTGKLVATNAYHWIEFQEGWVSGKNFPLSIWKGLSAIHYLDNSPFYYEREDIVFAFQPDGNLVITDTYCRNQDGSAPEVSVYHIAYENGLPVSCAESEVAVKYDDKGNPAELSVDGGAKTWTFLSHPRLLLPATMDEPKAQGMVAQFWARYFYNSNGDGTRFQRAYFSADQEYNDYYIKYFYDAHGNWIQREESTEPAFQHGQHFIGEVNREIEYY